MTSYVVYAELEIETFTLSKIGKLEILFSFISNKKDLLLNKFLIWDFIRFLSFFLSISKLNSIKK